LQKQSINSSITENKQDSGTPLNEISNFDNSLAQNTQTYISGYIVSHLNEKYSCSQRSSNLIQNDNSLRNDAIFLDHKSYNDIQKAYIIPTRGGIRDDFQAPIPSRTFLENPGPVPSRIDRNAFRPVPSRPVPKFKKNF